MISVSQLIKHYETPYNTEYFSAKKALSNIVVDRFGKTALFTLNGYLKSVSEDNGLAYMIKFADIKGLTKEFRSEQTKIKNIWNLNYKNKTREGIIGHEKEYGVVDKNSIIDLNINSDFRFTDGIYLEASIASRKLGLVGRVDKLSVNNGKVIIEDLKTGSLEEKHNYNKFKYPLDNWNQTPLMKARIQVSLYGLIIEDLGYKVDKLQIKHTNGFGGIITPVQYMKNEVLYLVQHYNENNTG